MHRQLKDKTGDFKGISSLQQTPGCTSRFLGAPPLHPPCHHCPPSGLTISCPDNGSSLRPRQPAPSNLFSTQSSPSLTALATAHAALTPLGSPIHLSPPSFIQLYFLSLRPAPKSWTACQVGLLASPQMLPIVYPHYAHAVPSA